jgi:hypothetical protein
MTYPLGKLCTKFHAQKLSKYTGAIISLMLSLLRRVVRLLGVILLFRDHYGKQELRNCEYAEGELKD